MKSPIFFLLAVTLFFILIFQSCGDKSTNPVDNTTPILLSITPQSGAIGSEVTLKGRNFGSERGNNYVKFNNTSTGINDYIIWSNSEIKIKVPTGAKTGKVTVVVSDSISNGLDFTVLLDPLIDEILPVSSEVGKEISIYGVGFDTSRGTNSYVDFNGIQPKSTDYNIWTKTSIKVLVPIGATTGPLTVHVNGKSSNAVQFTVEKFGPKITSLSKNSGVPKDEITISGTDFGVTRGTSFVTFNLAKPTDADYTSWNDNVIKVKVPDNATTGKITVTVSNKVSNGVDFVVGSNEPVINSLIPTKIQVGQELTINGINFGTSRGSNYVDFNGTHAEENGYITWDNTTIKVKVPPGAKTGPVKVYINGKLTNGVNLEIEDFTPFIEDMQPNTPQIGETVQVYGKNFGSSRGSSYIEFNGIKPEVSEYINWTDTKISVKIPYGTTTGKAYIYANSLKSNGFSFTILKDIVDFVLIKSGSFMMGTETGEYWDKPVHKITISYDFYMSKYEVTQKQWQAVFGTASNPSRDKGDNLPVEQLEWFRALKYCNGLSESEGLQKCYTFDAEPPEFVTQVHCNFNATGYRLPTEAEWEYACRAGTTTDFGGDGNINNMGWTNNDVKSNTQEVGRKSPNAWGLYDMHGNVYEFCWDGFNSEFYESSPGTDPRLDPNADYPEIVIRGGSYQNDPELCTSGRRNSLLPTIYNYDTGFRVVRKK